MTTNKNLIFNLFQEGKYSEAFELATQAVLITPEDKELFIMLGFCLYRLAINDMAYLWIKRALDTIEDTHPLYNKNLWRKANECLGNILYHCKRDYTEAGKYFSNALGMNISIDKEVNKLLGVIEYAKGNYYDSQKRLLLAENYYSLGQEGLFTLAMSSLMLEDFKNAIKYTSCYFNLHSDYKPAQFLAENISNENEAKGFRHFLIDEKDNADRAKYIGEKFRLLNDELLDVYQKREQCWHTSCLFNDLDGLALYALINGLKLNNIIEFSPYMGYSTVFIYKALQKNGGDFQFKTFDIEERSEFRENMSLFNISLHVDIGDALVNVPKYIREHEITENIDLCFIDSDHSYNFAKEYIDNIFPLLGKDCIIAIHDMHYCPEDIDVALDHFSPIRGGEICETITSIGEARAVREFFSNRDDYVLISTHKLFGGMSQCAPPLPINKNLLREIHNNNPFLNGGNYWSLSPMLIIAIPKHIWDQKEIIFKA